MKKCFVLVWIVCLITALCACGQAQGPDPSASRPADYDPGESTELAFGFPYSGIYKMREQDGDTWICRLSVPAWSTVGEEELRTDSLWHNNYLSIVNTNDYPDFYFSGISKSRDQMVISGITMIRYTEILDAGYTIPYIFGAYDGTLTSRRSIGNLVRGNNEEFETINGADPAVYYSSLSEYANIIKAEKGAEFTFGSYEGTSFVSDTCNADYFYCIRGDYTTWIDLPVTKTTDGYFIVDFSSLEPGQYLFQIGDREHTIIEILP